MNRNRTIDEAADWYLKLQDADLKPEELRRWADWSRSPENQQAFDEISDLSSLATQLDGAALRGAVAAPRSPMRWSMATAAVVSIAFGAAYFIWQARDSGSLQVYETAAAEHRSVPLSDGSSITLGAKTSLSVNITKDRRSVVLERGEALFTVAKDSDRPFGVIVGRGTITALGTTFNVHRDEDRVVVKVAEGRVQMDVPEETDVDSRPTILSSGEEVTYRAGGKLYPVESVAAQEVSAWREGRLQYRDESLKYVAADVDRYSGKRIVFGDRAAEALPYTGTVYQDRIDEWLKGLADLYPVEIIQTDGTHILVRSK